MSDSKEIQTMFEAGVHFGYSRATAHPSMSPYLYGIKDGVSIFDLEKTQAKLEDAKAFLSEVSKTGKVVFVSSKNESQSLIKSAAEKTNMPYVITRWIGGTITNFGEISKRITKLERMTDQREKGEFDKFTKKERLDRDREINKLEKFYGGLLGMKELPKAIVLVDPNEEHVAVKEAADKNIPVVAIASSDSNTEQIKYVIPANDSSRASIELLLSQLSSAIKS